MRKSRKLLNKHYQAWFKAVDFGFYTILVTTAVYLIFRRSSENLAELVLVIGIVASIFNVYELRLGIVDAQLWHQNIKDLKNQKAYMAKRILLTIVPTLVVLLSGYVVLQDSLVLGLSIMAMAVLLFIVLIIRYFSVIQRDLIK